MLKACMVGCKVSMSRPSCQEVSQGRSWEGEFWGLQSKLQFELAVLPRRMRVPIVIEFAVCALLALSSCCGEGRISWYGGGVCLAASLGF